MLQKSTPCARKRFCRWRAQLRPFQLQREAGLWFTGLWLVVVYGWWFMV